MQLRKRDLAQLVCRLRRHRPIFYIRPLKEELLNVEPKVVVLHDVITESEIAKIKEVATPRVKAYAHITLRLTPLYLHVFERRQLEAGGWESGILRCLGGVNPQLLS